ncbi:MAG: undecaprenyl-diphosphate phosphatase [Elusimicrobiota bacterium]
MGIINAFFLGLIQGVGEFLPISSSAHLYLYSYLLGFEYQGLSFDVMLHMGTLFAIFIYFFSDLKNIFLNAVKDFKSYEAKFLFYIFIATIPGAVAGVLLENIAERVFRTPQIVSLSLIIFSFVMFFIDRKYGGSKTEKDFNLKDAIIAGVFQSVAIIPGASRSGMTIIALLLMGYSRHSSARISFFMAIPIIFGAGIFEIRKFSMVSLNGEFIIAFLSSFLFGILSIKFLLSYLRTNNLSIFVIYRLLLGVLVILKYFIF